MFASKKSPTYAAPNILLAGTIRRIGSMRLDPEWEDNYVVLFEGATETREFRVGRIKAHESSRIFALTTAGDSIVVEVHVNEYGKLMVIVSNLTLGLSPRTVDAPAN